MTNNPIIHKIKQAVISVDPKAEVILFGSRVRGDHYRDSDWDILVVTSHREVNYDFESKLRDPIMDIEAETGQVISLLVYSRTDWNEKKPISTLFMNVAEEGISI